MQSTKTETIALLQSQTSKDEKLELHEKLHEEHIKDSVAVRHARKYLQAALLFLLMFEIFFIAYVMISQGIGHLLFSQQLFHLGTVEFTPFVNIVIIQTCILIRPIANNLFPKKIKSTSE